MTVAELIEYLSKMPPGLPVYVYDYSSTRTVEADIVGRRNDSAPARVEIRP